MINTTTNVVPSFLDEPPTELDKICWKRAYATFLNVNNKTPEEYIKEPLNLIELLPLFRSMDRKWEQVSPEMMKTTHVIVHRLKIHLERFKKQTKQVYDLMFDLREHQDNSADVDQTHNADRTASEKSDSEPEKEKHTELGLVNEPSTVEHQEVQVVVEEEDVVVEEPPVQPPQQEQVDVQVQTDDDPILGKRPRKEVEVTESDMGRYGPDLIQFLKARDAKKVAKKALKEAKANYQKACTDLEDMRDNFNAAFESSAEKDE